VPPAARIGPAAEIVDHHLGALARRQDRDVAADAAPRPGDDEDFVLEAVGDGHFSPFALERRGASFDFAQAEDERGMPSTIYLILSEVAVRDAACGGSSR